jgi:autotransporter-associated beta strand protein
LSIASSDALGSGVLDLVGSSTVPATLATTATTTIANAITVSGDPVFNVAPGTTTTITAPITDGVSAGDVVVTGGGTLAFTAANTYTGNTTVDSGSTLVLSGNGSIATSGTDATIGTGVFNNGIFNVTGVSANTVSIGTNFTQSSTGTLAMNFSPTGNQKLLVTGVASLAGSLSLTGSAGTYRPGRYSLLSASSITGTFGSLSSNLSSLTTLGYQLAYDAVNVYLVFTPNVADTQQSLVNTASALQNTYTLQNSILANSFSYDCNEFGANGICISVGGRNTTVSASNGLNNTSGLLIAAYRPHPNYRVGAYADQNLSVSNPGGTVNLGNNTPLIGLFGAWNDRLDGTGVEIKVSVAYGQKNTTITRSVVGTSEAGTGSSQLNSQGAQVTAKYGFAVMPAMIISPYLGIRYAQNNMGGYTETTSATVTAPLTYSALNTNATTALVGLGASYRLTPVVTTFASAGVETDTNTSSGTYSATGITGLMPINFNANPVKTRPTATLGAYYDVAKNQRLGVTGIYRQEPYQAASTTTVMATYTVGL